MSEETKHTSGPWQMHDPDYCPEEIWGDLDMADGAVRGIQVCEVNQESPNWMANARLITASPNMLNILREAIDEIQDHIEAADLPDDDKHPLAPLRHRMKSIVAKAEGGVS